VNQGVNFTTDTQRAQRKQMVIHRFHLEKGSSFREKNKSNRIR
jgi:hypothetical protein